VHLGLEARISFAQIASVFLGFVFIDAGYQAWLAQPAAHPFLALVSIASYVLGFAALALSVRSRRYLDEAVAFGFILAFVFQTAVHIAAQPVWDQYGTDALAFNHYSAQLLVHGRDPYASSMEPAYREFSVPAPVYTPTVNGGLVLSQSYPALSFLIYVPFVLLHLRSMLFVELGTALLAMLTLLFLAGQGRRAIAMLVFFIGTEYLDFAAGSVTDVIWLPFMIVVAAFWESDSIAAPIALGLACAIKQDPWFVVPFALVHWARMRGFALRNIGAAAAAFLLPNLPFIVWHPEAWLKGVLFPMISGAIPDGSGIVQLVTANVLPFPIAWLSWIWPAVLLAGIAVYAMRYRSVRWMPFVWPAVVLFFSPRSLQNYFSYWPIVTMTYLLAAQGTATERAEDKSAFMGRPAIAFAVLSAGVVAAVVFATTAFFKPFYGLRILGVGFDPLTDYARSVTLHVGPRAAGLVAAQFAVDSPENGTVFWRVGRTIRRGPSGADIELVAPSLADEIPVSSIDGVQVAEYDTLGHVVAYTSSWTPERGATASLSNLHMICASSKFAFLPNSAPLSWSYPADDVLSGELTCRPNGTLDGILTFRVPKAQGNSWNIAAVSQLVYPGHGAFSFWVKPGEDSTASALPTHLFGVSIIDGFNQQFYVITNSTIRKAEFLVNGKFRYYIVPGRLGAWDRVTVTSGDLPGFYVAPYGTVQVMVMDAIHSRDQERETYDEFGGFGRCPGRCVAGVSVAAK
jgi:uncharacterized membrane protein